MAAMYASYHGSDGLTAIAHRVHGHALGIATGLETAGVEVVHDAFFDTVLARVPGRAEQVRAAAKERGINVWLVDADHVSVSCDEATTAQHVEHVLEAFGATRGGQHWRGPAVHTRSSEFLTHPAFTRYRTETEMMRYLRSLSDKDIALDRSMIPLGSRHDEAQRGSGDGAHHMARVRPSAPVRTGLGHPGPALDDRRTRDVADQADRL